jgi:hypothetical protein
MGYDGIPDPDQYWEQSLAVVTHVKAFAPKGWPQKVV